MSNNTAVVSDKRTVLYVAVYLILMLVVCLAFEYAPRPAVVTQDDVQGGVVDLATTDLSDTVYYYSGADWQQSLDQWLVSAETTGSGQAGPTAAHQPGPGVSGRSGPSATASENNQEASYQTYRMELMLPQGEECGLAIKVSDCCMRVFIDGKAVSSGGLPTGSTEEHLPHAMELTYYFTPQAEAISIEVQFSDWFQEEDVVSPEMYVGEASSIIALHDHNLLVTALATGCLLTAFLYYLGIFMLNRRHVPTLVFSLCCLLMALVVGDILPTLFPGISWFVVLRAEYSAFFLIYAGLILFCDILFPRLLHKIPVYAFYALVALYILLAIFAPPQHFSMSLIVFEIASYCMIVYVVIRLAIRFKTPSLIHVIAFIGIMLMLSASIISVASSGDYYLFKPVLKQMLETPVAMIFFVFCYGLVVALRYAQTEQDMLQAQRNEERLAADNAALDSLSQMKSEYLANMSHEFKNPLTIASVQLQRAAELVGQEDGDPETIRSSLVHAQKEIMRMGRMTDEALRLAALQESQMGMELLDTSAVAEDSLEAYRTMIEGRGNELLVNIERDLPPVHGNADALAHAMANILSNANMRTTEGRITVTMQKVIDEEHGEWLEVQVEDTGAGIPPELLPLVFERGVTDGKGSGIGLAISKRTIDAHGGAISIDSKPDEGTRVRVTLPFYGDTQRKEEE